MDSCEVAKAAANAFSTVPRQDSTETSAPSADKDLEKVSLQYESNEDHYIRISRHTSLRSQNSSIGRRSSARSNRSIPETIDSRLKRVPTVSIDPLTNIVGWDGVSDPNNPINWSYSKKAATVACCSFITLIVPLASSMFAPGLESVIKEFDVKSTSLATFSVSVFILGFAAGPLLWSPLSELYGRRPIINITNLLYFSFTFGCGRANSINTLIALRFLSGFAGSCCLSVGGGIIADTILPQYRGKVMATWSLGPLLGPVIGPVCGGFMAGDERVGWRWIFYVLSIAGVIITIIVFFVLKESNPIVLLERKTKMLIKETGNENLESALSSGESSKQMLLTSLKRPFKLLLFSPIVLSLSTILGFYYGMLYLCFTTFGLVFQEYYGFSEGVSGLAYLGIGVGSFITLGIVWLQSDKIVTKMTAKNGGQRKPEYRLPLACIFQFTMPIGLILYGWTAQHGVHWIVPIMSTGIFAIGVMMVFMMIMTYLVDTFNIYAASAGAANTVLRSTLGALLPLAGPVSSFLFAIWEPSLILTGND